MIKVSLPLSLKSKRHQLSLPGFTHGLQIFHGQDIVGVAKNLAQLDISGQTRDGFLSRGGKRFSLVKILPQKQAKFRWFLI